MAKNNKETFIEVGISLTQEEWAKVGKQLWKNMDEGKIEKIKLVGHVFVIGREGFISNNFRNDDDEKET